MKSGIYFIKNLINQKIYIGSAIDLDKRFQHHRSELKRNRHKNIHLQNSWNSNGEDAFEFMIIEYCTKEDLLINEQKWINFHNSSNPESGYNICPIAGNTLGRIHTEESRKKISANHADVSGEKNPMFGKKSPNEGKNHSQETKEKISNALRGKKSWNSGLTRDSNRSIEKLSEKFTGEGNPFFGKKHTEETILKIKESRKISGANLKKSKINFEIAKEIRELKKQGISNRKIGKMFNISSTTVFHIVKNNAWKEE